MLVVRGPAIEMLRPLEHSSGAPPDGRMIGIMLERLATAPSEQLHLPMPSDPRLRRMADWSPIPRTGLLCRNGRASLPRVSVPCSECCHAKPA